MIANKQKTVHCTNCDAVINVKPERIYLFPHYTDLYRCPYCNSVDTSPTSAPCRPPKWNRLK